MAYIATLRVIVVVARVDSGQESRILRDSHGRRRECSPYEEKG